ncbi:hypothetical protein BN997_04470 [Oceanobacillus oncorhynchi]|uniref:Uncharacterized protein n=1 Tax=Oceanobacillus oncorhynchi TaxID=545501 RepID=A0A0A1MGH6_9BACI|nr:hypothetical protein BN997_04470 [Oceanobacillus oncorhynchi]
MNAVSPAFSAGFRKTKNTAWSLNHRCPRRSDVRMSATGSRFPRATFSLTVRKPLPAQVYLLLFPLERLYSAFFIYFLTLYKMTIQTLLYQGCYIPFISTLINSVKPVQKTPDSLLIKVSGVFIFRQKPT